LVKKVISSGYYYIESRKTVYDSFYGSSWGLYSQFPDDYFIELVKGNKSVFKRTPDIHHVSSSKEILDILESDPRYKHYLDNGELTFRGQNKEYTVKRGFPNSGLSRSDGSEPLIIPSVWRKYVDDFNKREISPENESIFQSMIADDIIYYGIDNYRHLYIRNFEKYGEHEISDLEHFDDSDSKEYYKRWSNIKVYGRFDNELSILSQHYGFDTSGLDLTFNLNVAAFFASNKFINKDNGKADFHLIDNGNHKGVIYCFKFNAPMITRTSDIIDQLNLFEHLNPIRPIRQECALPHFLYHNINEALFYVHKIFYLDQNFETSNLPDKRHLFPDKDEDMFYKVICDLKPNNEYFNPFVEYEFE
jgi:hypothetical protein